MSAIDYNILAHLETGPASVETIAQALAINPQTARKHLSLLVEEGAIRRYRNERISRTGPRTLTYEVIR